ncbi:MAG: PucR family transcriptional regulator [Lachnospiraceae bacterium]|nr:PucR family transcriptional regulator [Lachnospiraceae bacterium]
MAKVSDVLKLPALRGLKVRAGACGLERKVEHVTVMEVPEIKRWLKGNDLLITSFYSVRNDETAQCRLIRELADTCCCVAVKTGKYVDELPQRVKDTADECGLPLLEIPFEMAYIDVIVHVMNLIFEDEGTSEILGKYVKDILYENYNDEILMMERGRLFGFEVEKHCFVAVNLCFRKDYPISEPDGKALRFLCQTLQRRLKETCAVRECYKVKLQNGFLLLLEGEDKKELSEAAEGFITEEAVRSHWQEAAEKLVCGIGPAGRGLKGIRDTYSLCFKTMHVGRRLYRSQFVFSYRKLETFCALQELLTNDKSRVFTDVLKGIQSDELLDTVVVYYECGGSLDRTAERMFSHKNTVKYRLNRLQEKTGLDLKKPDDSFRLYLAILAMRLGKS